MHTDISQRKILLVDDSRDNIQILVAALRRDYKLGVATNGLEAIDFVNKFLPDLVLLDIMMPGINGYEVCSKLKAEEKTKDIPVIFITAMTELQDLSKGFDIGAADYITKPFEIAEVKARVRTHLSLKASREAAEAANRAKSDFLATMSHEIRTPLNAILGMTDLLIDTPLSEVQQQYVNIVKSAGETLLNVINDILDFSKVEAGRLELETVPFNPVQLIQETLAAMEHSINKKDIKLSYSLTPDVPITVVGDPHRLRQILYNLLGNAIKFTEQGEVEVKISRGIEAAIDDEVELIFSVRDTGIGIPQEKLNTIFESFTQADQSTTRRFGGTGLGLSISKKLVELMGGNIRAESQISKGSTFFFSIQLKLPKELTPLNTEEIEADYPNKPFKDEETTIPEALSPPQILLVEDSVHNRLLVQAYLKNSQIVLDVAEDGQGAVAKFISGKYDLILMDMQMPVMDGYAATSTIRKWEHDNQVIATPIIALTASALKEDEKHALEIGCDAYLTKPLKKQQLLDCLAKYLKNNFLYNKTCYSSSPEKLIVRVDPDIKEILPIFIQGIQEYLTTIQDALNKNDFETVRMYGHRIHGAGGGYGFDQITIFGQRLEEAAKAENHSAIITISSEMNQYLEQVKIVYAV